MSGTSNDKGWKAEVPWCMRLPRLLWQVVRWRALRGSWLTGYLYRHRRFDRRQIPPSTPIDVIVSMVDHFEPASRSGQAAAVQTVETWCDRYESLAAGYRDADGRVPQHTWFYRAEYLNMGCARRLSQSVFRGFGEIEFHLHHGHDTHDSFSAKLDAGLTWLNQVGAMLTAEPQPLRRFAYIAGNWALDNGAGDDSKSGCNTELLALRDAGCYADFTFPAMRSPAQPRTTNTIYYAKDDPRPKSYDTGVDMRVGGTDWGDLALIQGPLLIDWRRGCFEDGALEDYCPPAPERLPAWLNANVHVKGRPEWIFVKLHTHGMQSRDSFLGSDFERMLQALAQQWNAPPFRLHFATAREAYNIAKAAEAGHSGDPNRYRDFVIPPPANRQVYCSEPWQLIAYEPDHLALKVHSEGESVVRIAQGPLRSVRGRVRYLEAWVRNGRVADVKVDGAGPFHIDADIEHNACPNVVVGEAGKS